MAKLSPTEEGAIRELARELGIKSSDWLRALIKAESNFDPKAANPRSSAKGLIQFVNKTARGMGYSSSQDLIDRHPTFIGQLRGPVKAYLLNYAPFPTKQSLWMAVFLPKYRFSDPNTVIDEVYRKANPGIDTVADYMYFVENHRLPPKGHAEKKNWLPLALASGLGIWLIRYWK